MEIPVNFSLMAEDYQNGLTPDDEFEYSADAEVVTQEVIRRYNPSPLGQLVKSIVNNAEDGSEKVVKYAKQKPYQSIAIAGLAGMILGMICSSRR